nr:hypothetical protein [uncultured Moellerella sp.]
MLYIQDCSVDIENTWGEEIKMLMISHWEGDITERFENTHKYEFIHSIKNEMLVTSVLNFKSNINPTSSMDYWQIIFTTLDGKGFITSGDFHCPVYTKNENENENKNENENEVIININCESNKMLISYSNCEFYSTSIHTDNEMNNTLFYNKYNNE